MASADELFLSVRAKQNWHTLILGVTISAIQSAKTKAQSYLALRLDMDTVASRYWALQREIDLLLARQDELSSLYYTLDEQRSSFD